MPWALDPNAPAAEEVARLLRAQAALAVEALAGPDPEQGVHQARKAGKRARALLRAVPGMLPERQRRASLDRFRDAARLVAPARDAVVRLRTFDQVAKGRWPALRLDLAREALHVGADPAAIAAARDAFAAAPPARVAGDWPALLDGVATRYRRSRQRAPQVLRDPPERFHAWRRSVKDHMHQLQLLEPLWPPVLAALAAEADALQDRLGQHQDLHVLELWLDAHPARGGADVVELRRRLRDRGRRLRRRCLDQGRRVHALSPVALRAWLDALLAAERGR